jgi:hypothetical protein
MCVCKEGAGSERKRDVKRAAESTRLFIMTFSTEKKLEEKCDYK